MEAFIVHRYLLSLVESLHEDLCYTYVKTAWKGMSYEGKGIRTSSPSFLFWPPKAYSPCFHPFYVLFSLRQVLGRLRTVVSCSFLIELPFERVKENRGFVPLPAVKLKTKRFVHDSRPIPFVRLRDHGELQEPRRQYRPMDGGRASGIRRWFNEVWKGLEEDR
eukprot:gb/GECG01009765.1/.p1 GENE.gb/GECG01009765.1/~~gb/GECG01009765.1/.p1  ORF type:complete len:163 (+),score=6.34 gb/GECG01009765.1/:1-489(+)